MGFHGRLAPSQCETVSPSAMLQGIWSLGLGGASSRATTVSANPQLLWLPSQNGLLEDCPQRQRPIVVRPASPNGCPFGSTISKSSIQTGSRLGLLAEPQSAFAAAGNPPTSHSATAATKAAGSRTRWSHVNSLRPSLNSRCPEASPTVRQSHTETARVSHGNPFRSEEHTS